MGFVLRVRMASFFMGAAAASIPGLYILYNDYKLAHHSMSDQMILLHDSLDKRVATLEKFKQVEATQAIEAIE